jgi:hypothetical protein
MKKTEEGLVTNLRDILGGNIYYDYAVWDYDLTKIGITVKNAVAQFEDEERGIKYVHRMGDLEVESDFFQNFHIIIRLPQQQHVSLEKEGKTTAEYRISLDNASLSFYPNIEGGELVFSTDALHVANSKSGKLIAGNDFYFIKSGGGRTVHPNTWRISVNKLNWNIPVFDTPLDLDSLVFDAKLRRFPRLTMQDLYAVMLEVDKDTYGELVTGFFEDLYQRGATLELNEVGVVKDDRGWTSASGHINFDESLKPIGLISINTNQAKTVTEWLQHKMMVRDNFLSQNHNINKLFNTKELLSISLSLKGDTSYLNGLTAGDLQPITALLGATPYITN